MRTVSFVPNGTFQYSRDRSLRLVLAGKQTLYQTVLADTREIRSLKPRPDRGEALALTFSKECQRLWLYLPINNHHASISAQGIALSLSLSISSGRRGRWRTPHPPLSEHLIILKMYVCNPPPPPHTHTHPPTHPHAPTHLHTPEKTRKKNLYIYDRRDRS